MTAEPEPTHSLSRRHDVRTPTYRPHLRTALVLTGSGTAGAYHAGVLKALHEAGTKIDLVAGCGMGIASALLAAIDGGSRLWEPAGLWRDAKVTRLYRWRRGLRIAGWALAGALGAVLGPVIVLVSAAFVYPLAFFLGIVGLDVGRPLGAWHGRLLEFIFAPQGVPFIVPRLVILLLAVLLVALTSMAVYERVRAPLYRRSRGAVWWWLVGAPLDLAGARNWFADGLWRLIKGAAPLSRPPPSELSRRYAELLAENLGQPGFREVIVTALDVDARSDLMFGLLAEPYRKRFLRRRRAGARPIELVTVDLAGAGRWHVLDALAAGLALPVLTEPHLMSFAPDSRWRGETHRLCVRPDAVDPLLEEVAAAGVEQAILVTSTAESAGPHSLSAGRRDARGGAGEYLAAIEAAAVGDALARSAATFRGLFVIRPAHNPVGPFDFGGSYDDRSDRRHSIGELIEQGYEDAYRRFIEPVVGASGERLERSVVDGR